MEIPQKPNSCRNAPDDDFLALSLSSINYDERRFRPRPMSPSQEEEQQQQPPPQQPPIHPPQPIRPPPRPTHIQTILVSQNLPPQLPFRIHFNNPNPVPVPVPVPVVAPPPSPAAACSSSPPSSSSPSGRTRRNSSPDQTAEGKSKIIPPAFPWARDRKAKVHTIEYLVRNQILTITGNVQCKRCDRKYEMGLNLKEKFLEVYRFMTDRKSSMHDRAPKVWTEPVLPRCMRCGQEDSAKPIIEVKKKSSINWLFLWLGQLLGLCTLEQLKYFCKHTMHHRTAAKDRLLYLTYFQLGEQLTPGKFGTS